MEEKVGSALDKLGRLTAAGTGFSRDEGESTLILLECV